MRGPPRIEWPNGARFAFTIFDDTDLTTLVNGPPVYDVLTDLGLRFTKSVWPVKPSGPALVGGTTCADPHYLRWVESLQDAGHEIGFHNASDRSSFRAETILALDRFRDLFGHDPRIGADHAGNLEAMYWGPRRLTGSRSRVYEHAMALARPERLQADGHTRTSPYFWGDVLRDRIDYWRNFTFTGINTIRSAPQMPYHDPARPYVNWWFAASHAPRLAPFLDLVTLQNLDRLEAEGGVCIVYTHFGVDFAPDGKLDRRFVDAMEALAGRPGWFVPVSRVLDHIRASRTAEIPLAAGERAAMERRWIVDQVRARGIGEVRRAVSRHR